MKELVKHNKLYLIVLITILVFEAGLTGLLPVARGNLFGLLSTKSAGIYLALFYYFLNYLGIDFFQCFKGYVVLKVALWYRDLRTATIKTSIDTKEIARLDYALPSNTPQRIQEDIKLSYLQRITVWSEYFVSGLILIQLCLLNLSEPKLILSAAIYAVISVLIAARFNPRLTRAEIDVQQAEASYRTSLVTNILDITGLGPANKTCLTSKWIQTEYLLFTKLQLGLVAVLPYALLIPKLLAGTINLGQLVEHASTFSLLVVNAAIIIQMYTILIQGKASELRVKEIV